MTQNQSTKVIQPYLFFGGNCEEALNYYQSAIGAEIDMLMRYKEAPDQPPEGMLAPGYEDKVMHASFRVGATTIMASDGCGGAPAFGGFMLSLTTTNESECDRIFTALAEGGTIEMPLGKTFWSPRFGMIKDRFGLGWMITTGESAID
jgi:PhnB protein